MYRIALRVFITFTIYRVDFVVSLRTISNLEPC
jgi:hypothetical protein